MSDQPDNQQTAHLKQVNSELSRSLGRCRDLVDECRTKLAANSNEPLASAHAGQDSESEIV